jgi:hypothetical protein
LAKVHSAQAELAPISQMIAFIEEQRRTFGVEPLNKI